ncbi:MAG: sulfatase [Rubripirellula sp.]|nr:sulfatase [Rubripirellula sp.]
MQATKLFIFAIMVMIGVSARAADERPPNVLFIAVDDMNDWVGFLGGYPGQVNTPHLDALAASGIAFTNAHTAAPVCCPSRVAVMSGLLPSTSGVYNNQHWWKPHRPDLVTLPIHFRNNGYQSIGAGKIYHHTVGNNPPSQWDDYHRLVFNDNAWIRYGSPLYPYSKPKQRPKTFPFAGIVNYSGEVDWGVPPGLAEKDYDDAVTVDFAVRFLNSRESTDRPFFLACGVFHPHLPWYVPQRFLDQYPIDTVVVPEINLSDLDDIPEPGRKLALRKADNLKKIRDAGKWRVAIKHYLASISFADAQVGRLLKQLRETPHAENTIIVLWSDHGWHLGEKGHWHKRTLWEEATRVPLIISAPKVGRSGQRCDRPTSLVDLFPTLIELCDLPPVKSLDGISLIPWLQNPNAPRERPAIIVEEQGHMAVRTDRYRYIRYRSGEEELYDHRIDPGEHENLADRDELSNLKQKLANYLPTNLAAPAASKKSYQFNPLDYSWTVRKTESIISGTGENHTLPK